MPASGQQVTSPAQPSVALDPAMKQLLNQLKKCSDSLPTEVQQLVTEVAVSTDRQETRELHGAVNKLSQAKKHLTLLRNSRLQLHGAWMSFLQEASGSWKGYVKDFGEQDQSLQEQIAAAKEQLAQAKDNLQRSKEKVTEEAYVEEVSEDETMRDDVSKDIRENLSSMANTLDQLHMKAEASLDEMQQPAKLRKLEAGKTEGTGGGTQDGSSSKPGHPGPHGGEALKPFPPAVR